MFVYLELHHPGVGFQGYRLEERGGIPKLLVELLQLGSGRFHPGLQVLDEGRRNQRLQGMETQRHHFVVGLGAFGSGTAEHHKLVGEHDKGTVALEHGNVVVGEELREP